MVPGASPVSAAGACGCAAGGCTAGGGDWLAGGAGVSDDAGGGDDGVCAAATPTNPTQQDKDISAELLSKIKRRLWTDISTPNTHRISNGVGTAKVAASTAIRRRVAARERASAPAALGSG